MAGVDEARARLVQLGHLNKAGAVTTKGRNYLLGMRAVDKDRVQKAAEKATGRYFNRI